MSLPMVAASRSRLLPVLLLALPGLFLLGKRWRVEAILLAAAWLGVVLMSSGYENWEAGSAYGPRYQIPTLPLLIFGVALAGGGAGDVRIWPKGGTKRIFFGDPTNGDTMAMATGRIGIGTLSPIEKLDVVGNIRVSGCLINLPSTITGTCVSDLRYKKNIEPMGVSLERIAAEGLIPAGGNPERLLTLIKTELANWARVVKQTGLKAD